MPESKDFVLPNEQKEIEHGSQQGSQSTGINVNVREPMSGKEILAGTAIVIIGALMFFFISRWFTESMIKKRKSPSVASQAGWSLFFFLTFTTALLVFGFLGGLWTTWLYIIPMGLFVGISLIFFIISAVSK
ncbi:MAG: hypothetical protein QME81_04000 [bacterium]|nr:hypothetical protein [bacterium]